MRDQAERQKADLDVTISVDVHVWEDEDQTKIFIKKLMLEDDTIDLIWRDADKAIEKKLLGISE
jgi:hypothetical protein|tara:strand:- start:272 stop:463 length:192 start_codon:yes stop_codon:yes gene_type:complete